MRILTVVFASHHEFRSHFSDTYPGGALFCPTKAKEQLQRKVIVDVLLPSRLPSRLCGTVISISRGRGMWVHFEPQFRAAIDHLLTEPAPNTLSRAHSRYPATLAVRCKIDELNPETGVIVGHIADLSLGGAFVCTPNHTSPKNPLVGTRVSLDIGSKELTAKGLGGARFQIGGRVAWAGSVSEQPGFGVRFDQRGAKSAAHLRTALRQASEVGQLTLD